MSFNSQEQKHYCTNDYIFKLQLYCAQLLDSGFLPRSDLVSKCQIYIDLLWQRIHTIQTQADLENLGILD